MNNLSPNKIIDLLIEMITEHDEIDEPYWTIFPVFDSINEALSTNPEIAESVTIDELMKQTKNILAMYEELYIEMVAFKIQMRHECHFPDSSRLADGRARRGT